MQLATTTALTDLPPIVLLVDDDRDTLAMYSAYFESSGIWVATSTQPVEALETVQELRPDLIVTDVGFHGKPLGVDLVHTLKSSDVTKEIPVIVLSGAAPADLPGETSREADLYLVKPVPPDALLANGRRLIAQSHALRQRSDRARTKTAQLVAKSNRLISKAAGLAERIDSDTRPCPQCTNPLEWIEQGRIGGVTYDYYRWCLKGCGLYCYDRDAQRWVKLA